MMKQYIIEQIGAVEDAIEELKSDTATTESIVDVHTIEISKTKEVIDKISERIDEITKELTPNAPPTQTDCGVDDEVADIETVRNEPRA